MGFWKAIGSAAGSAGTGAIGPVISGIFNQREAGKQREWNESMWRKQNEWNLNQWNRSNEFDIAMRNDQRQYEMNLWNLQNKYNSPVEQMARLKEAGLNPHLMYGKGTVGTAGTPSSGQQPKASNLTAQAVQGYTRPQMQSVLTGLQNFGEFARLRNLQAQTDNVEQHTRNEKINSSTKLLDFALKNATFKDKKKLQKYVTEKARQNAMESHFDTAYKRDTYSTRLSQESGRLQSILEENNLKSQRKQLNDFEISLNKSGLTKNDDALARMLTQVDWTKVNWTNATTVIGSLAGLFATRKLKMPGMKKGFQRKSGTQHKQTDVYHWHMK